MTSLQWWCSAQNVAWSWSWRAYPGVWLFVLVLVSLFVSLLRHSRRLGVGPAIRKRRTWTAWLGLLLVWVALDWPVGALGGGYLASLHMTQFLLLAMIAPPLILLGLPAEAVRDVSPEGTLGNMLRTVTHPGTTLVVFNVMMFATHLPVTSDALMPSQLGAFVVDVLWLGGGLLYWWPIAGPGVPRPRFNAPLRIGYLFVTMMFMTAPGAMITFADLPLFATYELAPRVGQISALGDQRLAGLLMKIGGAVITWIAISIIFYRWQVEENRLLQKDLAKVRQAEG
jgi:cytochrome c oxidase assembly factor CtaG